MNWDIKFALWLINQETLMKLFQLKKIFESRFEMEATAANARAVLKNEGVTIVRKDFRCTATWEQLLDKFGLLSEAKAFEARVEAKKRAAARKERNKDAKESLQILWEQIKEEVMANDSEYEDDYCRV